MQDSQSIQLEDMNVTTQDLNYLRELQLKAFHEVAFNRLDLWADTWLRGKSFKYYINYKQERVGFISGFICRKRLHIQYFMIDPAFQGQGIGGNVLTLVSELNPRHNQMTLHTRQSNTHMQSLMDKLGFTKVDEITNYYKNGETAYYYSKKCYSTN